jgi:transglutaminase-like putative cysteine protease
VVTLGVGTIRILISPDKGATMKRRTFLKAGVGAWAGLTVGSGPRHLLAAPATPWRKFEVITKLEIANPTGITRGWVPLPLPTDTDYFKRQGDTFTGNAGTTRVIKDSKYDLGMVYAEWPATERAPAVEVTSRFSTRDRNIDLTKAPTGAVREDKAVLARYLEPTQLIPTDGIVRETAQGITQGAKSDVDKAHAIYEWIVENTFRDPKVRGCGLGDIKTMLETRYFGGKCADLNALYVGLARAVGLPARDVYGVRCADSVEFKSLGKSGDISRAQHCRAEVYLGDFGWVPVDPADVRKVVLEEKQGGLSLTDPIARRARAKLFGQWEMNWLPYNYAHDVKLANSPGPPVPFLMYPQAETAEGRRDSLDPATFRYQITVREITG